MNKILPLLLCVIAWVSFSTTANSQISIGGGSSETQSIPIEAYYGYSYSQTIYLSSEIGNNGTITTLSYFYSGVTLLPNSDDDIQIWMGTTTNSAFATSTSWEPTSGMTMVFDGSLPTPTSAGVDEWLEIDITDFVYNGTDNLVIAIDANEDDYDSPSDDFHCTDTSTPGRSIYYRNDSTNPDPASPPIGSLVSYIPNIILGGISPSTTPNCSTDYSPADGDIDINIECGDEVYFSWAPPVSGPTPDEYWFQIGASPTALITNSTTETNYSFPNLVENTTYYYRVVPRSNNESATGCPILSFTTGDDSDSGSGGTNNVYYFANNNNSDGTAAGNFNWDDPIMLNHTEITTISTGSFDDGYHTITLPFTFSYYGVEYTTVYMGTNGYASFGQGYTSTGSTTDLGSSSDPDNMIALAMMDLDDRLDGKMYYGPIDANTYALTWYRYHDYQDDSEWITMQLILQDVPGPDNDPFEIRYNEAESSTEMPDFMIDAVVGCEDTDVNATTEYARYREDGIGGPLFCSPLALGFAASEGGVSLPLELLEWKGESMEKENILTWKTTNEVNTSHFSVEKLYNQSNWRSIATSDAAGFSTDILSYSVLDHAPNSKELYRLKSIDIDGQFTYSEIVEVNRKINSNSINVYPNPFSDEIQLEIDVQSDQKVTVQVIDVTGKIIKTLSYQFHEGKQFIQLDLSNQVSGIYLISMQLEQSIIQKRILKE